MKTMEISPKPTVFGQSARYSSHSIFEAAGKQRLEGLSIATCNPNVQIASQSVKTEVKCSESEVTVDLERKLVVADCMTCSCCQTVFEDRDEQLGHYKCDWHRYNLHLRLKGLPFVTEEEFEEAAGDVSSISGSDEDDEVDSTISGPKNETPLAETPDIKDEGSSSLADRKFHKVFFKTEDGELVSVYRCLLHHRKNPLYEPDSILNAVSKLPEKNNWIILMVSSGHFAGAVFRGNDVIDHKTFHRYTVRAKRGTAQSSKDGQGGAPKSAGATLRRYNEAALVQDVQDLMSRWEEHIRTCDFVFARIPVASRFMFFGGKNPAFKKDDSRIRVIPFSTRRPTFSETKRVHQMLASVECYGQEAEVGDIIPLSPPRVYDRESGNLIVRKGIQDQKPVRGGNHKSSAYQSDRGSHEATHMQEQDSGEVEVDGDCREEEVEVDLVETLEEIDFTDLKEFDCSVRKRHTKKKKPPSADKQNSSGETQLDKEVIQWRNSLFTACKTGCLDSVQALLEKSFRKFPSSGALADESVENTEESDTKNLQHSHKLEATHNCVVDIFTKQSTLTTVDTFVRDVCVQQTEDVTHLPSQGPDSSKITTGDSTEKLPLVSSTTDFLNISLGDDGTTFLHVASKEGHSEIVTALLSAGADPAIKNKAGKTPYNLGESGVRNVFRRFMAKYPDQYDYAKAQIPSPLTAEMEAEKKQKTAEKRKAKKKGLLERNKEKKAAEAKIRAEIEEKERFLALSDREKRALAAERRILQQSNDQGTSRPVMSRCWQCGTDITGKVPFEYSDYKFCTTKCLREHRSKSSDQK